MTKDLCHLCSNALLSQPVIRLEGMPKAAQYYPTANEFANDHGISLSVYQCQSCGLLQLNNEPVDYYKEVITAAVLSEKARSSRLEQMRQFVAEHHLAGKSVLEVGSGNGGMLEVLEEADMRATGIEASAHSVAIGQSLGRKMVCDYIGHIDTIPGTPFSAFVSLNYLEHLPDPGTIIQKIHALTTPDAVGFVTVPNLDYLLASKCFYEFVADHLSYFTASTLRHAFEKNGFDVLKCHTINNDNDVLAIVRKRKPVDLSGQYHEVEHLIDDLRQIVKTYKQRQQKVAVWGAGHRTLALLALAGLHDLECVIDSAAFKQGRFTPVLHKLIVAPQDLRDSGIGLIIVMVPGLYPGEVLKTIQGMHLSAEIAILKNNTIEFLVGASSLDSR